MEGTFFLLELGLTFGGETVISPSGIRNPDLSDQQ
jgi:hypothetical protein